MKPKMIDLFSGCGGISLGFHLAGYEIAGGIDFNADAVETFQYNFPEARALCTDIREIKDEEIRWLFSLADDIDVIAGGPPCQGFSAANRWQKDEEDIRNRLFFEFIRFVRILRPKAVLIENVRGILTRENGYAKERIYSILEELGYVVNSEVLDASDYGVPQKRMRAFFVAVQGNRFDFTSLKRQKKQVRVIDAIGELYPLEEQAQTDIYRLSAKPENQYARYLRNREGLVFNHEIRYPAPVQQERIRHVPQGGNWQDIPQELFDNKRNNRHSSAYKRLSEQECSVTIDTGNAHSNYFHPVFNRIPTVREAARLQSFHDGFIFRGSRSSQYRQVGNAVPPLLARTIATAIKEFLK